MDLIAPHEETLSDLKTILSYIDYFMPSLEEAEAIAKLKGPAECGVYFLCIGVCRACIFKAGANGSFLVTRRDSPDDQELRTVSSANGRIRHIQNLGEFV
jgi:sugar/nucleoside kinase (ribokinase family)